MEHLIADYYMPSKQLLNFEIKRGCDLNVTIVPFFKGGNCGKISYCGAQIKVFNTCNSSYHRIRCCSIHFLAYYIISLGK